MAALLPNFFVSTQAGEDRIHSVLVALLPKDIITEGAIIPPEDTVFMCVSEYRKVVPFSAANWPHGALALSFEDCIYLQYCKIAIFVMSLLPTLMGKYVESLGGEMDRAFLSTQSEKGITVLHNKVISLLMVFSWDPNWYDFHREAIPRIHSVMSFHLSRHFMKRSTPLWIRLLISLNTNQQEMIEKQAKQAEKSTSNNFLQELTTQANNTPNTYEYEELAKITIDELPSDNVFEILIQSLQSFPFPQACTNLFSLTLPIQKRINGKCGILLSKQLVKPGGIPNCVNYFMQSISSSKNQMVAVCCRVICKKPSFLSETEWFYNCSSQLLPALESTPNEFGTYYRVIWEISARLLERNAILGYQYLLKPFLQPLLYFQEQVIRQEEEEQVSELEMEKCVLFLWKLTCIFHPSSKVLQLLTPIIYPLFQLHCFLQRSVLQWRTKIEKILLVYFHCCDDASAMFKQLILPSPETSKPLQIRYAAGGSGGVIIRIIVDDEKRTRNAYNEAESLTWIIKKSDDPNLAGNLFIELMNEMQKVPEATERYLILFQWLVQMLDEFGESILKEIVQVCTFLKVILQGTNEKVLALSLAIISSLLSGAVKLKQEEMILIYDLETELERIEMNYPDLSELAGELRTKILVNDKSSWVMSKEEEECLVEERTSHKGEPELENLEKILKDLSDPLLPVRGHGLIALRRLVLARNQDAQSNLQKILSIFRNQLDDDDTYIYGNAIDGLLALGDVHPKEIIPLLAQQAADSSKPVLHRLKVNESLLKISQRCGETLPFHVKPLVHSFLLSCKDADCTVRASGLSNIAELCNMLRFGLHPFVEEIVNCVYMLIITDNDEPQVKRGCMFVFYLLIEGLGIDAFQLIPSHLGMIQEIAERFETDVDAVTSFHASNTLKYINEIITWTPEPIKSPLKFL